MNYIQVLTEYLTGQFPGWKHCKIRFEPIEKTLYIYCQWVNYRDMLMKQAEVLVRMDIGVSRFIITVPQTVDIVIECQSAQDRRSR